MLRSKRVLMVGVAFVAAVLPGACNYNIAKQASQPKAELDPEQKAKLSYAMVRDEVLVPRCVECHGTQGSVNLESYAEVMKNLKRVAATTLGEKKTMPKDRPPLTPKEAGILSAWIELGGPEEAGKVGQPTPSPTPDPRPPLGPTFASIMERIFKDRCLGCHSPAGNGKKVKLDTVEDMIDSDLVVPEKPYDSILLLSVMRSKGTKAMPPAKAGEPLSLTLEEILVIRDWIQDGAKN